MEAHGGWRSGRSGDIPERWRIPTTYRLTKTPALTGATRSVDEYSAAGEGAEGALEDEVAELEERWCELTERIRCRRIGCSRSADGVDELLHAPVEQP